MSTQLMRSTQRWSLFVNFIIRAGVALLAINAFVWGMRSRSDFVSASALALSIVVGYVGTIRPLLRKPRLALFIDDRVPCSPPVTVNDTPSWFLRVGVVNCGLTPARDCVGRLLEVRTAESERLPKFDPLTLYWARQDNDHTGFSPVVIQGGGDFEYLDVAQVKKGTTPVELRVVIAPPMTLSNWPSDYPSPGINPVLKAGTYCVLISVHAADAYVNPSWFEITCDAPVPGSCDEPPPCRIRQAEPDFAGG